MPTTLLTLRTRARRRCDQENSNFISDAELTTHINASNGELYDMVVAANPDYNTALQTFTLAGSSYSASLPVDYLRTRRVERLETDSRYRRIKRFNFAEDDEGPRGYRILGASVFIQPETSASGSYRLWYIPRCGDLAGDTDSVDYPNGWEEYIVVDAALKCLVKEESSIESLSAAKEALRQRIMGMLGDRDADEPERVGDTTSYGKTWRHYP